MDGSIERGHRERELQIGDRRIGKEDFSAPVVHRFVAGTNRADHSNRYPIESVGRSPRSNPSAGAVIDGLLHTLQARAGSDTDETAAKHAAPKTLFIERDWRRLDRFMSRTVRRAGNGQLEVGDISASSSEPRNATSALVSRAPSSPNWTPIPRLLVQRTVERKGDLAVPELEVDRHSLAKIATPEVSKKAPPRLISTHWARMRSPRRRSRTR